MTEPVVVKTRGVRVDGTLKVDWEKVKSEEVEDPDAPVAVFPI